MSATALKSKDIFGDELYQQRARVALPILVRQAHSQRVVTYKALAEELGMPNPRNLNYVLGSVARTLMEFEFDLDAKVPELTLLVVNQSSGVPGDGVDNLLPNVDWRILTQRQQQALTDAILSQIWAFPYWDEVLLQLCLTQVPDAQTPTGTSNHWRGSGESPEHARLKLFLAENPQVLGLGRNPIHTRTEFVFPSDDAVDILFQYKDEWVVVEVKSIISNDADIRRGLFQCVKYLALTEAIQNTTNEKCDYRCLLAIEGQFPGDLVPTRNALGITVYDQISVMTPAR